MKTLPYYTRRVYGNDLIYLADGDDARDWFSLTGKKTITMSELTTLELMFGVELVRVFEPVSV
jgi:hypothetical protein